MTTVKIQPMKPKVSEETDWYKVLTAEDLQNKVDLNLKSGFTLETMKASLLQEKHDLQRTILRYQGQIHKIKIHAQNLQEQIAYIDHLFTEGK